MVGISQ